MRSVVSQDDLFLERTADAELLELDLFDLVPQLRAALAAVEFTDEFFFALPEDLFVFFFLDSNPRNRSFPVRC